MRYLTGHRVFLLCIDVMLIAFVTQLREIPPEARTYPMVFIILGLVMSIILLIRHARQSQAEKTAKEMVVRILIFAFWILVYILLMSKIGYILSSLLFLYGGEWLLGLKRNVLFWVFPLIMTLVMYLLFTRVLSVILPIGTWFGINF